MRDEEKDSPRHPVMDWDQIYAGGRYRDYWEISHPSPELVTYLACRPREGKGVALDLGCGTGKEAIFLAQCGYRVHGIDFSIKAIELARVAAARAGTSVTWHHGDVLDLPFADHGFDLIIDRGCFHHIPERDRPTYAGEVMRVLKAGGEFLLRGSSRAVLPFVPVTPESVCSHFGSRLVSGPVLPIHLMTGGGLIEAVICLLKKPV